MKNKTNKLTTSHYAVYAVVLLLAVISGVLSSVMYLDLPAIETYVNYFEDSYFGIIMSAGFIYGVVLFFSILLLNKYSKFIRDKKRLYRIAALTVVASTIGYFVAFFSFFLLPALLDMPRANAGLLVGGLTSGTIGALITFLPLQFTDLFKRWWVVILISGVLAALASVLAIDYPSSNNPSIFYFDIDAIINHPLILFLVWQVGISTYLVFCSYRRSRYNENRI